MRGVLALLVALCLVLPGHAVWCAEPLATFQGDGDATTTLVTVPERWVLRWAHDRNRLTIRTILDGEDATVVVEERVPGEGQVERTGAGRLRLTISANGSWTVQIHAVEEQVAVPPPVVPTEPSQQVPLPAPAEPARGATSEPGSQLGQGVRLETRDGVIEGTLLDRLPHGYLVRVGGVTVTIAYEDVVTVEIIPDVLPESAPAPVPEPSPVEEPPAADEEDQTGEAPEVPAATHIGKLVLAAWPMQLTFGYVVGLGPRRFDTAVGRSNPNGTYNDGLLAPDRETAWMVSVDSGIVPGFALGADALIDSTSMALVPAGGQGCSLWLDASGVGCLSFEQPVAYETSTTMLTTWARPYYAAGFVRAWAGLGLNLAFVTSRYVTGSGTQYGSSSDTALTLAYGVGIDGRVPINARVSLVGSIRVTLGSPIYDEAIGNLFLDGLGWSRSGVGHMTNPTRVTAGIGIGVF